MKNFDKRLVGALGFLALSLLAVLLISPDTSGISTIKTYPATVCPANLGGGVATSILPSSKVLVRQISAKKNKLSKAKTSYYLSSKPLLVDGNRETSINVTRGKSRSLATAICSISGADQWFVGGSGAVTSRASIEIINSGLSTSVVDLFVYGSNSVSPVISNRISKNSSKRIYIDTLAPGEDAVAIHAITRSGRVTTYMHDERVRGLQALGADFVSQGIDPAKKIVIPAISNVALKSRKSQQVLRILVPGKVSASVQAKLVSSDGTFTPIGLDNINADSGRVTDLTFKPVISSRNFALVLTSDQPIVAAVKSSGTFNGVQEFAWSSPVPELKNLSIHLGGLRPDVLFQGKNFEVDITWTDTNNKIRSKTIRGTDVASWRPGKGVKSVEFRTSNSQVVAGAIFREKTGVSYLPLMAGAQLESAAIPTVDAYVITRE
jgi:hypothetical protein